jgi:uncharacterized protein Yka (UPF0111/DUF47 family)
MEISKLSQLFHVACERVHEVIDDLYEALHDDAGVPLEKVEEVEEAMDGVKSTIFHELDLIKAAVDEHESESEKVQ